MTSRAKETSDLQNCTLKYKEIIAEALGISPDMIGDPCPHVLEAHPLLLWTLWADKDGILHPSCVDCLPHLKALADKPPC